MDGNEIKEFKQCPSCGGTERFHEELAKALKGRGLVPPNYNLFLQFMQGVVTLPPQVEARVPIGAEVPAYAYATDICTGCGTIYAVRIQRGTAKKEQGAPKLDVARLHLPGMNDVRSN